MLRDVTLAVSSALVVICIHIFIMRGHYTKHRSRLLLAIGMMIFPVYAVVSLRNDQNFFPFAFDESVLTSLVGQLWARHFYFAIGVVTFAFLLGAYTFAFLTVDRSISGTLLIELHKNPGGSMTGEEISRLLFHQLIIRRLEEMSEAGYICKKTDDIIPSHPLKAQYIITDKGRRFASANGFLRKILLARDINSSGGNSSSAAFRHGDREGI